MKLFLPGMEIKLDTDGLENNDYLNNQIITYIGNKRKLLSFIGNGLSIVREELNQDKLNIFDVFSGSGIVSRYFKQFSKRLYVNDMERYSEVINRCYLSNPSEINEKDLREAYQYLIGELENKPLKNGFISDLYAPKDDNHICKGERVFFTQRNAQYIDSARQYIEELPEKITPFFLAPLLAESSVHANTSGVFKGFYKDSINGIGKYGGNNANALQRIKGNINIPFPLFSKYNCSFEVHRGDSNSIAKTLPLVDLAYLDPPYNQHPYGSNYFMLNLITDYTRPEEISSISGIPKNWNRSKFNKKNYSILCFKELIQTIKAKYLLISFNSEGFISCREMIDTLKEVGDVRVMETRYNTFKGSRNLKERDIYIKEFLYLVKKK